MPHPFLGFTDRCRQLPSYQKCSLKVSFQAICNGFFSVDIFFFLSGLLVAYLSVRELKRKNGRFPFLSYYFHRYLRLTPTYAFILFFIWLLMMHLADGPMYHFVGLSNYHNCKNYWWTNLFYVNNLYPWRNEEECIPWTWYLNDMQFYIFAPLILIPLYFLFPLGLVISAIVLLVSFVISGTLAGTYDHQANEYASIAYNYTSNNTSPYTPTYTNLLYVKPWHRVALYIVGLILGYVLYFHWHGHVPTTAENVMYIMFSRFTWSLGLALLVISCHYGYGGPINQFLRWNSGSHSAESHTMPTFSILSFLQYSLDQRGRSLTIRTSPLLFMPLA